MNALAVLEKKRASQKFEVYPVTGDLDPQAVQKQL